MTPDQLVAELHARHGIQISAKDPVVAIVFLNDLILSEQVERTAKTLDGQLDKFSREIAAVLANADGDLGQRLASGIRNTLSAAAEESRTKLQAVFESGRVQTLAAMHQSLEAAQLASRDAANARLWAICCAGIALIAAAGILAYAFISTGHLF